MTNYRALCAELFKACETLYKQSVTASHHQTITLSNGEHPIPISSDMLAQDAVFGDLLHRTRTALTEQQGEAIGPEWQPCVKLPITVHVREQRPGETHVSTREGITPVQPDDLIMRGVAGEEYPIGRELFNRTYRLGVAEPTPPAEWEVAQLVAWLRAYANGEQAEGRSATCRSLTRAAELLQQFASPPCLEAPSLLDRAMAGDASAARQFLHEAGFTDASGNWLPQYQQEEQ